MAETKKTEPTEARPVFPTPSEAFESIMGIKPGSNPKTTHEVPAGAAFVTENHLGKLYKVGSDFYLIAYCVGTFHCKR